MKIGIVTLPLSRNFGGILQNYALQTKLTEMGHESMTIDIGKYTWLDCFIEYLKYIIKLLLGKKPPKPLLPSEYQKRELVLRRFVLENIDLTTPRMRKISSSVVDKNDFQAIVVGSDQVWRPKYAYNIYDMYLNFARRKKIKKIAYAASFGVGKWEYTLVQTKICRELISKFDAVSVRESSAVHLCERYLKIPAVHVLDPTLLLTDKDYNKLIEDIPVKESKIFAYFLDSSKKKIAFAKMVAKYMGLQIEFKSAGSKLDNNDSIENWLVNFRDSDYVITDSFHGCAFSIIYNKPFSVISNKSRGQDRMSSLLGLLDLTDRILYDEVLNDVRIEGEIDWTRVNAKLNELRTISLKYLQTQLEK